jgi:hypothetical protein
MKRKILLLILTVLLLALSVHAAETVRLDELGLTIEVPEGYYVITRNMASDDPALAVFDMDSDQVTELLEKNDVYLDLMNEDAAFEISMTMTKNQERTMNQFTEDALESMEASLAEQYESSGLTVHSVQHFTQDSTVFFSIYVSGEQNGNPLQLLRYQTVHNYQTVIMDMQYWGSSVPEKYERLARSMIASIHFDQVDEVAATVSSDTGENSFSLIEESAAAKQESDSESSSLISQNSGTGTSAAAAAKKKRFPTVPVVLGLIFACAAAGAAAVFVRKKQKDRAQQTAAPVKSGKPAPRKPKKRS